MRTFGNSGTSIRSGFSRRSFIARSTVASASFGWLPESILSCLGADLANCPIVAFSKVYQELKLNFADAADVTAEVELDGVDSTVRPGGEILPERAVDDLPKYVEGLRKRKLSMPLITTAITKVSSPHAEEILRTAKKMGVAYYRLGFVERDTSLPTSKQVTEFKAWLKDLSAMNQQIGIGALVQNHSSGGKPTSI